MRFPCVWCIHRLSCAQPMSHVPWSLRDNVPSRSCSLISALKAKQLPLNCFMLYNVTIDIIGVLLRCKQHTCQNVFPHIDCVGIPSVVEDYTCDFQAFGVSTGHPVLSLWATLPGHCGTMCPAGVVLSFPKCPIGRRNNSHLTNSTLYNLTIVPNYDRQVTCVLLHCKQHKCKNVFLYRDFIGIYRLLRKAVCDFHGRTTPNHLVGNLVLFVVSFEGFTLFRYIIMVWGMAIVIVICT